MKKKILAIILALTMTVGMTACSGSGSSSSSSDSSEEVAEETEGAEENAEVPSDITPVTASMSTPQADNSITGECVLEMNAAINEATNGAVTINYFGAGALGDQATEAQALANGELEMIVDGSFFVDQFATDYGFLSAPFMIKNVEHLEALMDSEVWEGYKAELAENNVLVLGAYVMNMRQVVSVNPIDWESGDFSSIVFRSPDVANYITAWTTLGFNVQIIPGSELYSSLQTGVVTATEGPLEQHVNSKMAEICNYVYETNHVPEFYCIYASKSWFESLDETVQETMQEIVTDYCDRLNTEMQESVEDYKQELINSGMEYVVVDTDPLIEALSPVWEEKFNDGTWAYSYDEIMGYAD